MQAWIDTVLVNLGYLFMIEPTGVHFYILSGVVAACLLIFGKLIATYLVGSEKGFLFVFDIVAKVCIFAKMEEPV